MDAETVDLVGSDPSPGADPGDGAGPGLVPLVIHQRSRPRPSWPQRGGGLVIAALCVAAAIWYVPRVIHDDSKLFTGTVTSSGMVDLNFTKSGYLASVPVHAGQPVHKGQMLAAEYAPAVNALITADKAAIASDQARLAQLKAVPVVDEQAQVAAAQASLAKDQAQLASDKVDASATQILAPSDGTVVAVNGQPGETVSADGIRTGATSQPAQTAQAPLFSLLPEGPQASRTAAGDSAALPVVALRTSASWHVVALIPESTVSSIRVGQPVTVSVPAAGITHVRGQIDEVLPTPTATSGGTAYQTVIGIAGHEAAVPLDGMAADVRVGS
jgi:multidrug efflux pump subunit AcrA (membrane-fusion protein)